MDEKVNANITALSAKALAKHLSLSVRTLWRYRAMGALPKPLKISGSIRWRESDIALWQEKGCPDQKTFEAMKGGAK
jgi:predicted DNA-binding transcriptional regulator AlpA